MSTRVVVLAALCVGGSGLSLAPMSLLDSCLPGTSSQAPGWTCYSPPWARPALALSATLLAASLLGLILAGLLRLRGRAGRRAPSRSCPGPWDGRR